MKTTTPWLAGLMAAAFLAPAQAADIASVYTRLDLDGGCTPISADEAGGSWSCQGQTGYGVLFAEGDLRQSVFFGHLGTWFSQGAWESFGPFNHVNDTIEWRLADGVPFATILRWFIENPDPATGSPDDAHTGQVLVVSKVGQPGVGEACVVGYVDALANSNANVLARQVADASALDFACRSDAPAYHGNVGPLAGQPMRVFAD